jgi:mannose-6-phosphate isomerase-like protein (cupin superfamily)
MKRKTLQFGLGFRVALGTGRSQAAEMSIKPGGAEGGPGNRHRRADQYLYVVSGNGVATVNGRAYPLRKGVLLLVERGDEHEIRNTGRFPLRTLNFYNPRAYTAAGDELPAARP